MEPVRWLADRGEVVEPRRFGELEGREGRALCWGQFSTLGDSALCSGEGDQVHAVELASDVAPRVSNLDLGNAQDEQCQPAQLHMGADAVLAMVIHRSEVDGGLRVALPSFNFEEGLVSESDVLGRERLVGRAEEELAIEFGIPPDGRPIDAQLPRGGATEEALVGRLRRQRPVVLGPRLVPDIASERVIFSSR